MGHDESLLTPAERRAMDVVVADNYARRRAYARAVLETPEGERDRWGQPLYDDEDREMARAVLDHAGRAKGGSE
jgi:hypothetical protein